MYGNIDGYKMKQDGLILAPSTVDDWHQGVCDKIEPLYNLQMDRVMSSLLLGADGSPFPILDCEKHKMVNHYLIQYRSVATGIQILRLRISIILFFLSSGKMRNNKNEFNI